MIFYKKSPRFINYRKAKYLVEHSKNKKIDPVGVFVNENIETVKSFIKSLNLKIIQLHGNESNEYIKEIKKNCNIKVIRSVAVKNNDDFKNIYSYEANDYFLFDYKAKENELPGGNAKKFNWSVLSELNIKKPWFLSGGINISNINKIKEYANPDGIDLSSGVEEAPGIKNTKMINRLFNKYYEK